jgi:dTDP-4-dehydrorhamnose reductase
MVALEKRPAVLHLGGPERISRYAFGRLLSEVFDVPDAKLIPRKQSEVTLSAPRPPDVSLDITLARSLGFRPRGVREALEDLEPSM